jgi:copper(I)-binding protein
MKLKGTVERTDMGAGAFVLKTDDGKQFQLVGADKSIKKAGLKVEIDGDLDSGNTAAMVAPLLRVTGFKIV